MRRHLASFAWISAACLGPLAACSSSSSSGTEPPKDGGVSDTTGGDAPVGGNFALTIPCTDAVSAIYGDPGTLTGTKGAIIYCHQDPDIAMADLQAAASGSDDAGDVGYAGPPFTSGAHVYRILYETVRGNSAATPGYSSAIVYVPTVPRASMLPVVLAAHGSRGQAGKCAPSLDDPSAAYVEPDFIHQVYPLVGAGYVVIAPDLAGYSNYGAANNPPSGYAVAADGAQSMLDGARAMQKMLAGSLTTNVVITGHSVGGETALSTFALWQTYAPELNVSAVAVYAPDWVPGRAFGAILLDKTGYPVSTSAIPETTFWYFYTKAALELGPAQALSAFVTDSAKQAAITNFVNNDCWSASYPDLAAQFGHADDAILPSLVTDLGPAAGPMDQGCGTDTQCAQWMTWFNEERPHITGAAQKVPLLFLYGGEDTTITPDLMSCGHDRLVSDGANMTVCFDPAQSHSGIVATKADYVNQWIAAQVLGGTAPAACPSGWPTGDAGLGYQCNPLIVNNED